MQSDCYPLRSKSDKMKHCCSALFLALFCLAAQSLAKEVEISEQELKALEQQLKNAPLVDTKVEFDDGDGSKRIWNPIAWIKNKLRNKCKCEDLKCECCFKIKIMENAGCIKMEKLVDTKQLAIRFAIGDTDVVKKNFDLQRNDQVCGSVPGSLSFLKFCFNQAMDLENDGTVTACSNVELRVGSTTGAVLQFSCLHVKNGNISFGGYKEIEKDAMLSVKAKNPFLAAIDMYQKIKGKN